VSWDSLFRMDSNLDQDENVGHMQSCWKILEEFPGQNLTSRNLVKSRNVLQESCFQSWKPFVCGQTLFTRHRPHKCLWSCLSQGAYVAQLD
jgi:hypothetical protein